MESTVTLNLTREEQFQDMKKAVREVMEETNKPVDLPEYFTGKQLEVMFHVTRLTLLNWEKAGKLQGFKVGRQKRFSKESVDKLMKKIRR